jgi:3',5'-cyclic AMP phosphodiesterase CpdA
MAADSEKWLIELSARVALAGRDPSLMLLVTREFARINDSRRAVAALLRSEGHSTEDLGALDAHSGPSEWSERTQEAPVGVHVLSIAPTNRLASTAFAEIANAQRESLRESIGPLVLVISAETEVVLRKQAPDFVTWIAQSWELPSANELMGLATDRGAIARVSPPTAPPIRFLHLSDLHFSTAAHKKIDQDRVLRGLFEMLEREQRLAPLDLIFVTGDLANSASSEEYVLAAKFIARLLEVTGVPREKTFVVPGNHDVDRGVGRWLMRTLQSNEASTEFFGASANRRWHTQKFEAWSAAMRAALGDRPHGLAVGRDAVEFVEVRGTRIAVALFNTAWFACADDDEGKLWLGEANIEAASAVAARADLSIALMHHPVDDLAEAVRDAVSAYMERYVDLLLRGHLHKTRAQVLTGGRGVLAEIVAPAAYQGSRWANGCFVGEVRADVRTLRVRPFTFGTGVDPWTIDTKVFPSDAADGHAHTFLLGERAPTSYREAAAQASAADLFWLLPPTKRLAIATRLGVEGSSTRETEERTAEYLVRSPEGAEVLREFSKSASAPHVSREVLERLVSPALRAAIQQSVTTQFSRDDPAFLRKALVALASVWAVLPAAERFMAPELEAIHVIAEVLSVCVDGPVSTERASWSHEGASSSRRSRVDVLIGERGDPSWRRAVIEVKDTRGSHLAEETLLAQMDRYLAAFDAVHAGMILLATRDIGAYSIAPERTPAGHDVQVLRLP